MNLPVVGAVVDVSTEDGERLWHFSLGDVKHPWGLGKMRVLVDLKSNFG